MRVPTISSCLFALLSLPTTALSLPTSQSPSNSTVQINTIYEFPNTTWVENIAVRRNGKLLVTLVTTPEVWQIDPTTHSAELIYRFPNAAGASGIAEVEPDVFAVAVGNWSVTTDMATPGSYSIWSIDFRDDGGWGSKENTTKGPEVQKVTDMPEAQFLNGMTVLPTQPHTVLVGDADRGLIYRVDIVSGAYSTAIDNPDLKPDPTASLELGVNGIRYHDGYVHFVNTFRAPIYSRIPVLADGSPAGPVEEILPQSTISSTSNIGTPDDFAVDQYGTAWIATDPTNTLIKATLNGEVTVIAGGIDETTVLGCTSAAFGRNQFDRDTLYITSNGGMGNPPASGIRPGKVWSIDTSAL